MSAFQLPDDSRIINELLVETVDPNIKVQKLIWWIQLIETTPPVSELDTEQLPCASQATFFRVQAKQIASDLVIGTGDRKVRHLDYTHKNEFEQLQNAIELKISHTKQSMRFGPVSYIFMVPRGTGLGSFLMSQAIEWAKARWPHYSIDPGKLGPSDANTDEERDNRNDFYRKLGFDLHFPEDESEKRTGYFTKSRVDKLNPRWSPKKLQVLSVDRLYAQFVEDCNRADENQIRVTAQQDTLKIKGDQLQRCYKLSWLHWFAHFVCFATIYFLVKQVFQH